jgi:hypothetical protein
MIPSKCDTPGHIRRAPCPSDDADSECQLRLGFKGLEGRDQLSDGFGAVANTEGPTENVVSRTLEGKAASAEVALQCRNGDGGTSVLTHSVSLQCHCHRPTAQRLFLRNFSRIDDIKMLLPRGLLPPTRSLWPARLRVCHVKQLGVTIPGSHRQGFPTRLEQPSKKCEE